MSYVMKSKNTPKIVTGWPVFISTATDGGGSKDAKMTFDFEIIPQSAHDAAVKAGAEKDGNIDGEIMRRVVKGWGSMTDEEGADVPFSEEALEDAIDQANIRQAFIAEYVLARSGKKASRKN